MGQQNRPDKHKLVPHRQISNFFSTTGAGSAAGFVAGGGGTPGSGLMMISGGAPSFDPASGKWHLTFGMVLSRPGAGDPMRLSWQVLKSTLTKRRRHAYLKSNVNSAAIRKRPRSGAAVFLC